MSRLLSCCFRGFLVLLPVALIGYLEYIFYKEYILSQLKTN